MRREKQKNTKHTHSIFFSKKKRGRLKTKNFREGCVRVIIKKENILYLYLLYFEIIFGASTVSFKS